MDEHAALRTGTSAARCKAAATLGERGDDVALGALFAALDDRDEAVRDCVVAALRAQPAAVPFALREGARHAEALQAAKATAEIEAATFAFGQHLRRAAALADGRLLALVERGLGAGQPRFVRSGAAWCLAAMPFSGAARQRWAAALADADKDVRWPAADGLVRALRGADAATRAAIVALAEQRLATEADPGVRAKLQTVVGAAASPH